MAYRVELTALAASDAAEAFERVQLVALQSAARWLRGLFDAILTLREMPAWLEYLLPDVPGDRPDLVALEIGLRHLSTDPLLDANVCWEYPSGWVETDLFPEPVPRPKVRW